MVRYAHILLIYIQIQKKTFCCTTPLPHPTASRAAPIPHWSLFTPMPLPLAPAAPPTPPAATSASAAAPVLERRASSSAAAAARGARTRLGPPHQHHRPPAPCLQPPSLVPRPPPPPLPWWCAGCPSSSRAQAGRGSCLPHAAGCEATPYCPGRSKLACVLVCVDGYVGSARNTSQPRYVRLSAIV